MSLLAPESRAAGNALPAFDATPPPRLDASQANRFTAHLDRAWSSLVGIHGGYLTAIAIRAAQHVVGERPIRTVTTTFLRPGSIGNAAVDVEVVRRGRS